MTNRVQGSVLVSSYITASQLSDVVHPTSNARPSLKQMPLQPRYKSILYERLSTIVNA